MCKLGKMVPVVQCCEHVGVVQCCDGARVLQCCDDVLMVVRGTVVCDVPVMKFSVPQEWFGSSYWNVDLVFHKVYFLKIIITWSYLFIKRKKVLYVIYYKWLWNLQMFVQSQKHNRTLLRIFLHSSSFPTPNRKWLRWGYFKMRWE